MGAALSLMLVCAPAFGLQIPGIEGEFPEGTVVEEGSDGSVTIRYPAREVVPPSYCEQKEAYGVYYPDNLGRYMSGEIDVVSCFHVEGSARTAMSCADCRARGAPMMTDSVAKLVQEVVRVPLSVGQSLNDRFLAAPRETVELNGMNMTVYGYLRKVHGESLPRKAWAPFQLETGLADAGSVLPSPEEAKQIFPMPYGMEALIQNKNWSYYLRANTLLRMVSSQAGYLSEAEAERRGDKEYIACLYGEYEDESPFDYGTAGDDYECRASGSGSGTQVASALRADQSMKGGRDVAQVDAPMAAASLESGSNTKAQKQGKKPAKEKLTKEERKAQKAAKKLAKKEAKQAAKLARQGGGLQNGGNNKDLSKRVKNLAADINWDQVSGDIDARQATELKAKTEELQKKADEAATPEEVAEVKEEVEAVKRELAEVKKNGRGQQVVIEMDGAVDLAKSDKKNKKKKEVQSAL